MDGKWGGWGPSYWWYSQKQWGFAANDVVEWHHVWTDNQSRAEWYRVWIDKNQKWRALTAEEITRLPELNKPTPPRSTSIPVFPRNPAAQEALAVFLTPTIQSVIESAPIITNLFQTPRL